MRLNNAQREALEQGEAVAVTVGQTECVILRKDVYERVKAVLFDDGEMDPCAAYPAVLRAWDSVGSPEDATLYQDVEPEA